MSKAYKCDVCGKLVEGIAITHLIKEAYYKGFGGKFNGEHNIDICPACEERIINFMSYYIAYKKESDER